MGANPGAGAGGGVFLDLLTNLVKDCSDLRSLLQVLLHFLAAARDFPGSDTALDGAISTQTEDLLGGGDSSQNQIMRLAQSVEPVVVIRDAGRETRMVCPVISLVATHSRSLAAALSVSFSILTPYLCL